MRITLTTQDDRVLPAHQDPSCGDRVNVAGPCPSCRAPWQVRGKGPTRDPQSPHDTYRADAVCVACSAPAGVLRVSVDTIFGIEEDERVLHGRCRVY